MQFYQKCNSKGYTGDWILSKSCSCFQDNLISGKNPKIFSTIRMHLVSKHEKEIKYLLLAPIHPFLRHHTIYLHPDHSILILPELYSKSFWNDFVALILLYD